MLAETKTSPLKNIEAFGQSIWLDYIDRGLIRDGRLQRLISQDGLRGVTSNPSIFEKAFAGKDYDSDIARLVAAGKTDAEIYETLTVQTVREAADVFHPLYDGLDGTDGFVSLEVSPHLAHDTQGTVAEARRLWNALGRPNVLIKIPATEEGIPAIRQCISEQINVNVTLLFGLPRYLKAAEAYVEGLEILARNNKRMDDVASVASFFLSRIDTMVDPMLERAAKSRPGDSALALSYRGQTAIACAKAAYQMYCEIFGSRKFRPLMSRGARAQRLLWASTSTKNPAYCDVHYVEPLIGPNTINTLPMETLDAYRDHGDPVARLDDDMVRANDLLAHLPEMGINLADVADKLEREGIDKFVKPYESVLAALKEKGAR